jgi:hypothetical protein
MTIKSDNAVTVYNLQRQGAGMALLHLTRAIFSLLQELDIRIHVSHVPGIENVLTDALSGMDGTGDYGLRKDVFPHAIAAIQVQSSVDLFANKMNSKCPTFIALAGPLGDGATARDAFSLNNWETWGLPYIFPPVALIDRVLRRIMDEKLRAVIVIPKWPSNPWWGLLKMMAITSIELGRSNEVLAPGPLMCSNLGEKKLPPGLFLTVLVDPTTLRVTVQ